MRLLASAALTFTLAVPATSEAISVVLTPSGGNPNTDGITSLDASVVGAGPVLFDFYLDIAGTAGAVPNQVYADSLVFGSISAYQFVMEANTAKGVSFVPQGPFSQGYAPANFWINQVVGGDCPATCSFTGWNDFTFFNVVGIPPNIGDGGFEPGQILLGSLQFDIALTATLANGDSILTFGSNTFVDGLTAGTSNVPTTAALSFVPEPSVAVLLGLSLACLALARREV